MGSDRNSHVVVGKAIPGSSNFRLPGGVDLGGPSGSSSPHKEGGAGGDDANLHPSAEADLFNIEDCELIEFPSENAYSLVHDLTDCDGFHDRPPLLKNNADYEKPETLVKAANGNSSQKAIGSAVGHLVPPNCIGIYEHNGNVRLCAPGRYQLWNWRCSWVDCKRPLNEDHFGHKTLVIVRVPRGKMGLAVDNGQPFLMDLGTHVFNSGLVHFERLIDINQDHIKHGPYNLLRVPRGKLAKCWVPSAGGGVAPRLLREGMHCIEHILFKFVGMVEQMQAYINHGSVHLLQVPKGKVAKVFHDNLPRLLGAGVHAIEAVNFLYCGLADLQDKIICHGTITIVRVNLGEIGVTWDRNQPHFIEKAGLYAFNSPDFKFIKHVPINERVIELGAKKIVMVYTGEVGISYDHGELRVLQHGRHIIDASTHMFEGFLSTQQKSIRLVTLSETQRKARKSRSGREDMNSYALAAQQPDYSDTSDLMACETKDLVKVGVRADVFYSIVDPEKTLMTIKVEEIEDLLRETAIATLTNIIRSTALNEIAQSKMPSAISAEKERQALQDAQATNQPSAPLFFDKAHDEFLSKLHDDFVNKYGIDIANKSRYGIDIANIRIESFKIMDDELAESISKQALVTAQTENELANLQGKTEIATAEQHRVAEVTNIAAEADARSQKTTNDAANERQIAQAKAQAEAQRIKVMTEAQADAEAAIVKAKAEAESIRLVAEAEAERAELLSKTALGAQTSLLSIYADMVAKTNQGIEKIVYCDPSLTGNGNPFTLPALQNLNRDLNTLSTIGLDGQGSSGSGGNIAGGGVHLAGGSKNTESMSTYAS